MLPFWIFDSCSRSLVVLPSVVLQVGLALVLTLASLRAEELWASNVACMRKNPSITLATSSLACRKANLDLVSSVAYQCISCLITALIHGHKSQTRIKQRRIAKSTIAWSKRSAVPTSTAPVPHLIPLLY